MESSEGRAALSQGRSSSGCVRPEKRISRRRSLFWVWSDALLFGRDRDHAGETVRPVLHIRLGHAIKTDHRNLRCGNTGERTNRSEFLIVQINGGVGVGWCTVEAGLTTISQEIRPQLVDDLVGVRCSRRDDLVLRDHL